MSDPMARPPMNDPLARPPMSDPMSDERLAQIRAWHDLSTRERWLVAGGATTRRHVADLLAELDRRGDLLDWISSEATEAHFLPTLNGAITPTVDGAMVEGRLLADALHRIGASIHPERWVTPPPRRALLSDTSTPADDEQIRAFAASLPPSVAGSIRCHLWPHSGNRPDSERYSGVRWEMEGDECDTYGNAATITEAMAAMAAILGIAPPPAAAPELQEPAPCSETFCATHGWCDRCRSPLCSDGCIHPPPELQEADERCPSCHGAGPRHLNADDTVGCKRCCADVPQDVLDGHHSFLYGRGDEDPLETWRAERAAAGLQEAPPAATADIVGGGYEGTGTRRAEAPPAEPEPVSIWAPWSYEQVAALNTWQRTDHVHPFTCPYPHAVPMALEATINGWVCPARACGHTQSWAYDFMFEPIPPPFLAAPSSPLVTPSTGERREAIDAAMDDGGQITEADLNDFFGQRLRSDPLLEDR